MNGDVPTLTNEVDGASVDNGDVCESFLSVGGMGDVVESIVLRFFTGVEYYDGENCNKSMEVFFSPSSSGSFLLQKFGFPLGAFTGLPFVRYLSKWEHKLHAPKHKVSSNAVQMCDMDEALPASQSSCVCDMP